MKNGYGMVYKSIMQNSDLAPESKCIYAYLSTFADSDGICYPSMETMIKELKMGHTRIAKYMKQLVDFGVIEKTQVRNKGIYSNNVYRITHKITNKTDNPPSPYFPHTENPISEKPYTENGVRNNTNNKQYQLLNNTNSINIDNDNIKNNFNNIDINSTNDGRNTNKVNGEVDTTFSKKSLPTATPKKTREELEKLKQDMVKRFYAIGKQYDVSDNALKNVSSAFVRYLQRYTEKTGKIHPILTDKTLEKIFVTMASVSDTEYGHFDFIADEEPNSDGLSYLDMMVDEHFRAEHSIDTDWHISHFANQDYLDKMAQHVVEW